MSYRVVFAPAAEEQLDELYSYIAAAATPKVADDYVGRVIDRCEGLADFPITGMARDDIRPGLRTISYRKRTVIAFAVVDDLVLILGVFHGGRDYESALAPPTGLTGH